MRGIVETAEIFQLVNALRNSILKRPSKKSPPSGESFHA